MYVPHNTLSYRISKLTCIWLVVETQKSPDPGPVFDMVSPNFCILRASEKLQNFFSVSEGNHVQAFLKHFKRFIKI